MRKIISIHQISLDGVIQGPGGPTEDTSGNFVHGGWAAPFEEPVFGEEVEKLMSQEFDLLLGRRTFEIWQAYWPYQDGSIAEPFNKATKYVATNTLKSFTWAKTEGISGDAASEIHKLKESDGPDFHLWGSSKLFQTLVAADLIDEYRVWIFPIVIGEGKRLWENGVPPRTLSLVESRSTASGIILNTYHPSGPLKTGAINDQAPSEKELARQKKHASES